MNNHTKNFSGVFVPLVTPFRGGEVALDHLRYNLRKLAATELTGYLALGSNGESRRLSDDEQFRILDVIAEEKGGKTVMVGTGRESTKHTIEITRTVAAMGFQYASVRTPCYFAAQMNDAAIIGYYTAVADASPIPILLYNAPGYTGGVQITPKAAQKLAEHPNIIGMKDSSPIGPDKYLVVLDRGADFIILAGTATILYPSLLLGAVGGIVTLANALPKACCELYNLFIARQYDQAVDLHSRLARLNTATSGVHGVPGIKAAMDITGYQGGEPRLPLTSLNEMERNTIRRLILSDAVPGVFDPIEQQ